MKYLAEFVGSLVFLLGGYAYMCNISLKKTLVSTLNYIELVFAWSLAVGFGLATAVIMRGYQIIVNLLGSSLGRHFGGYRRVMCSEGIIKLYNGT